MNKNWLLGFLFGALMTSCGMTRNVHDAGAARAPVSPCESCEDDDGEEDEVDEEEIPLAQVPDAVKKAAEAAVPGFVAEGAEKETEEGALHYCLHGHANGEFVEVEVDTSAKVLEIERGEDEEDD